MSQASRQAFNAIPETCPKVRRALEDASEQAFDKIKETVTEPFREALIEAHQRIIELEEQLSDMEESRDEWQERAERWESDYNSLREATS